MIRVFFPAQNVPKWLQKVEITKGYENDPESKLPEKFKFLRFCIAVKFRGYFWLFSPVATEHLMVIEKATNVTISGQGRGVMMYAGLLTLGKMISDMANAK